MTATTAAATAATITAALTQHGFKPYGTKEVYFGSAKRMCQLYMLPSITVPAPVRKAIRAQGDGAVVPVEEWAAMFWKDHGRTIVAVVA